MQGVLAKDAFTALYSLREYWSAFLSEQEFKASTHSGYLHPLMGLIKDSKCLRQCATWRKSNYTYTYAFWSSEGLTQPLPTLAEGAAVNVGAGRVLIDPVGVYVGKRDICVPVNEGPIVGGGNTRAVFWLGVIFPASDWYRKDHKYTIVARIKTYASCGRRRVSSIENLRWAEYGGTMTCSLARIYNPS